MVLGRFAKYPVLLSVHGHIFSWHSFVSRVHVNTLPLWKILFFIYESVQPVQLCWVCCRPFRICGTFAAQAQRSLALFCLGSAVSVCVLWSCALFCNDDGLLLDFVTGHSYIFSFLPVEPCRHYVRSVSCCATAFLLLNCQTWRQLNSYPNITRFPNHLTAGFQLELSYALLQKSSSQASSRAMSLIWFVARNGPIPRQ